MMRSPSAASWRVGLVVAVLAATQAQDAAAQDRGGGAIATGSASAGNTRFPVGLGIGLGVATALGILDVILGSREPPVETASTDGPPREPPPPFARTSRHSPVAAPTAVAKRSTSARRGSSGRTAAPARPGFAAPAATEHRYASNEVLVVTKGRATAADLRRLQVALGLTPVAVARIGLLEADVRLYRLRPGASVSATIRALRAEQLAAEAEPNFAFDLQDDAPPRDKPSLAPAKPPQVPEPTAAAPVQYAVAALHLVEAHRVATGMGVRVAIIDSGVDETNPNLEGAVVERFDAVGAPFAAQAHGTAMAGAIVAHRTLIGVAPRARLIAIRAFAGPAATGVGSGFNVLRGLDFAAAHAARIVNMSFAGPRDMLLRQALAAARARGIVAVAAAGNGGAAAKPLYPAAEAGVIAVTATDASGKPFARANRGTYIAVAAPGVDIVAPGLGDAVQITTGTSIASAEASGVAALLLEQRRDASPDAIRRLLTTTARPLPEDPAAAGAGLIDAAAAVGAAR